MFVESLHPRVLPIGWTERRKTHSMRWLAYSDLKNVTCVLLIAASCMMLGCSSQAAPAELTAAGAGALIAQRWSQDELDHLKVSFHSDTLIECGVKNDLWKRNEITDRGYSRTVYQL